MGAADIVVGVSLVIILAIVATVAMVWRKRVLRRRDEPPRTDTGVRPKIFGGRATAVPPTNRESGPLKGRAEVCDRTSPGLPYSKGHKLADLKRAGSGAKRWD
jgi:membrane protein implicated in regulation of membrane protease activity